MKWNVGMGTLLAVGALAVAGMIALGTSGRALAQDQVPSSNPYSGNLDAIAEGKNLYLTNCVACHGIRADGQTRWRAANLRVFNKGYSAFLGIVKDGRTGSIGSMPSWAKVLNKDQISKIGAYLELFAIPGKADWKDRT